MPKLITRPASESCLNGKPGRDMDHLTTYQQIGTWTLLELGAKNRLYSTDYIQFDTAAKRRRVIVKLDADDTYTVEIGRVVKVNYLPTYQVISQLSGVYCDQLAEIVRNGVLES